MADDTDPETGAADIDPTRMLPTAAGPIEAPARVLVVVAHPDDVDFGAAGTVAALTNAGSDVAYCIVTSGEAGSDHLTIDAAELQALREEEQTAAAKEVGVSELHWLHHPDGAVEVTIGLRRDITAVIRRTRPDVIITQSPERQLDRIFASHPDHMAAGEATLRAVYPDARNPRAYPELLTEGLEPHTVTQVWMSAHKEADLHVDVTDTFDRKIAALRAHASQTGHRDDLEDLLRGWQTMMAEAGGLPEGRLAEAFRIVVTG